MKRPVRHIWEEGSIHRAVDGDEYDKIWDYVEYLEEAIELDYAEGRAEVERFERGLWTHPLERGIEGLPVIKEMPETIHNYYYTATNFMPIMNYGRGVDILDGEMGTLLLRGPDDSWLPVLRVVISISVASNDNAE